VTPISRSERGMLIPLARLSPSIFPARNAVAAVTGMTGTALLNSGEKALAILVALRCIRPRDTESEFEERHHGYGDLIVTGLGYNPFEQLSCVPPRSFGGDGSGGVEDQSQAGGSSGSRCAAIAASTSAAKSGSITAVESVGSSAMHSEILRPGVSAGFSTAMA
jgi:hypothetical protein